MRRDKESRRWRAGIRIDGKQINLGYLDDPQTAAMFYARAAEKYYGEYGRPKVPDVIRTILRGDPREFETNVLRNLANRELYSDQERAVLYKLSGHPVYADAA